MDEYEGHGTFMQIALHWLGSFLVAPTNLGSMFGVTYYV